MRDFYSIAFYLVLVMQCDGLARSQRKASSVNNLRSFTVLLAVMTFVNISYGFAVEPKWGTLQGQIVLDGDVPKLPPLVTAVPGIVNQDVPDERVVVDPKTKGIANIIIYLPSRPLSVHPDLEKYGNVDGNDKTDDEVVFDRKDGRFVPHAMIVRTNQKIRFLNNDAVVHNVKGLPMRNNLFNFHLKANDREGVVAQPMSKPEKLPFDVRSDIHPWMRASMLIVDHPYAVVTGKDGRFEILNFPVGKHEFRIWHEAAGFLEKNMWLRLKRV